jgi:hypothetical protein
LRSAYKSDASGTYWELGSIEVVSRWIGKTEWSATLRLLNNNTQTQNATATTVDISMKYDAFNSTIMQANVYDVGYFYLRPLKGLDASFLTLTGYSFSMILDIIGPNVVDAGWEVAHELFYSVSSGYNVGYDWELGIRGTDYKYNGKQTSDDSLANGMVKYARLKADKAYRVDIMRQAASYLWLTDEWLPDDPNNVTEGEYNFITHNCQHFCNALRNIYNKIERGEIIVA